MAVLFELQLLLSLLMMHTNISAIKKIHPWMILEWELKRKRLSERRILDSIHPFRQILRVIAKGKRGINPWLSARIVKKLGVDKSYFVIL